MSDEPTLNGHAADPQGEASGIVQPSKPKNGKHNNLRHKTRVRFTLGNLPRNLLHVQRDVEQFRRELEALVTEVRGKVSTSDAALIDLCCKHERHGRIAQRLMKGAGMDPLEASREALKASERRNECLTKLGIIAAVEAPRDQNELDPAALYAALRTQQAAERAAPPAAPIKPPTAASSPADGPSDAQEAPQP